jgi:hypothetical protein
MLEVLGSLRARQARPPHPPTLSLLGIVGVTERYHTNNTQDQDTL